MGNKGMLAWSYLGVGLAFDVLGLILMFRGLYIQSTPMFVIALIWFLVSYTTYKDEN